ncbi:putative rRNA methyltransferase YqxC [Acropora muricata]|uniref:putative rRNA methyltransferase YqxC n=1 Tax=Acropora muricata TaxID=159855 RepID=UPI0034E3A274
MAGQVLITDPHGRERRVEKAGERYPAEWTFRLKGDPRRFASRAGDKLDGALDAFGIDVAHRVCADIGISSGGFTDCLLSRGARRVHGVDVAYGTVDLRLREDPRVTLYERTNARLLGPNAFGEPVEVAVIDVSFISVTAIVKPVTDQLAPTGSLVILVKPQFEASRHQVGPGGS